MIRLKTLLWLLLAISLAASYTAFGIRASNDGRNKTILAAADYEGFREHAKILGQGEGSLFREFRSHGINTAAIYQDDTEALRKAKAEGFEVLLMIGDRPFDPDKTNDMASDAGNLEAVIANYNVRYIMFRGSQVPGYPSNIAGTAALIKKYGLVIALEESKEQTGIIQSKGLDELLESTGYPVNRMYVTPREDLSRLDGDGLYHRWLRGVTDRSIRFILAAPLEAAGAGTAGASKVLEPGNAYDLKKADDDTLKAVSALLKYSRAHGYLTGVTAGMGGPWKPTGDEQAQYTAFTLLSSNMIVLLLFLEYLFEPRGKKLAALVTGSVIVFFCISLLFTAGGTDRSTILSLPASILYPALSFAVMLRLLKRKRPMPLLLALAASAAAMLAIDLAGGYSISAATADLRHTMGFTTFKGVAAAYIMPIILFALSFYLLIRPKAVIFSKADLVKAAGKGRMVLFFTILFFMAFCLYLIRSTTEGIIKPGFLELELKKLLEDIMTARPRFKEFLVGYPSLSIFVYLFGRYQKNGYSRSREEMERLMAMAGIGAGIGNISVVNSFCHVFTPIFVSLQRTMNGALLGLPMAGLALLAAAAVGRQANRRELTAQKIKA